MRLTKEVYGWDPDAHFLVPEAAARALPDGRRARPRGRGRVERTAWTPTAPTHPELAAELDMSMAGELPDGWDADVPRFDPADDADRHAQGVVAGDPVGAAQVPQLVSGSADLEPSTLTEIEDGGSVAPRRLQPAATSTTASASTRWARIVNGLNLHMVRALRLDVLQLPRLHEGALRLAALMHLPAIASTPTTRSASARTARPTSRSSSSRTCARRRTSTRSARPTPTRRRWPGGSRCARRTGPTALVLTPPGPADHRPGR